MKHQVVVRSAPLSLIHLKQSLKGQTEQNENRAIIGIAKLRVIPPLELLDWLGVVEYFGG